MVSDLEYFGGEGNDLHVSGTEFTGNRAEDTSAAQFAGIIKQHAGVVVEADVRAVGATDFLLCTDDDGLGYSAFLNVGAWDYAFDGNDDDVAHGSVAAACATEDMDAEGFLCTAVVGYG